ncbi:metal-dependent hydrolase, partial [Noviherbaspirillum denitrificans]|uniref:metal-dependent hydrolase n=1 Tax=Noviherbaspirillum denitrificans TaxID=1968433 RepID=UPI0011303673
MDNLSHSVAGLAAGELLHRCLPQEEDAANQRTRRRLLLFTAWAASNFPDLDLVLTSVLPAPLGYLMHHRGHTHTLLYAIPQGLLLWGLIVLLWPGARHLLDASAAARKGFLVALAGGLLLHLSMDFLNSYGIHPFHPFDSHWVYGDMVFILEPVFWIAFGVPVAMMAPLALRIVFLALLAGAPAYFASKGFLHWGSLAAL